MAREKEESEKNPDGCGEARHNMAPRKTARHAVFFVSFRSALALRPALTLRSAPDGTRFAMCGGVPYAASETVSRGRGLLRSTMARVVRFHAFT